MHHSSPANFPGASPAEIRAKALTSATVFRDCALRAPAAGTTRQRCRTLMRDQAILWRHPVPIKT